MVADVDTMRPPAELGREVRNGRTVTHYKAVGPARTRCGL